MRSVSWICKRYGQGKTDEALVAGLPKEQILIPSLALEALKNTGLACGIVQKSIHKFPKRIMPAILIRKQSGGCILLSCHQIKNPGGIKEFRYLVILPEVSSSAVELTYEDIIEWYLGYCILVKPAARVQEKSFN